MSSLPTQFTGVTVVTKANVYFDGNVVSHTVLMPDNAKNFAGNYGYNTSQCNGVYYNPAITYLPPVKPNSSARRKPRR